MAERVSIQEITLPENQYIKIDIKAEAFQVDTDFTNEIELSFEDGSVKKSMPLRSKQNYICKTAFDYVYLKSDQNVTIKIISGDSIYFPESVKIASFPETNKIELEQFNQLLNKKSVIDLTQYNNFIAKLEALKNVTSDIDLTQYNNFITKLEALKNVTSVLDTTQYNDFIAKLESLKDVTSVLDTTQYNNFIAKLESLKYVTSVLDTTQYNNFNAKLEALKTVTATLNTAQYNAIISRLDALESITATINTTQYNNIISKIESIEKYLKPKNWVEGILSVNAGQHGKLYFDSILPAEATEVVGFEIVNRTNTYQPTFGFKLNGSASYSSGSVHSLSSWERTKKYECSSARTGHIDISVSSSSNTAVLGFIIYYV